MIKRVPWWVQVSATTQTTCDPRHAFTLWMLMGTHSCPGLLLLHSKCNNIQSFVGYVSASGYRLSVSYHDSHMTHRMTDAEQTESMLNQTDLWFFRGIRRLRKVGSEQTFVMDRWSEQTAEGAPLLRLIVLHPSPKRSVQTFGMWPCDALRLLSQWENEVMWSSRTSATHFHTQEMEKPVALNLREKTLNKQAINK